MDKRRITMMKRITWSKHNLDHVSIGKVLSIIKSGSLILSDADDGEYTLKDITEKIRFEKDEAKQNDMKMRYLPAVTFNGLWNGNEICSYSNVTVLDFDHIYNELEMLSVWAHLQSLPFVLAIFRTFKAYRLKALILHDNNDMTKHREMYMQILNQFDITQLDTCCQDLSRKTFLPWDDEIWINPEPCPYHFVSSTNISPVNPLNKVRPMYAGSKVKSPHSIVNILNSSWKREHPEFWQRGHRAVSIFKCACQFCEYGVPQEMAEEYFLKHWEDTDLTEDEIFGHVDGAYKRAKSGSRDFC